MKPQKEITFRWIAGKWQDVTGDSGTLAEYLQHLDLIIDDKCQFARFYTDSQCIYYRVNGGKIIITIWMRK